MEKEIIYCFIPCLVVYGLEVPTDRAPNHVIFHPEHFFVNFRLAEILGMYNGDDHKMIFFVGSHY